jgi:hypothetical protein
MLNYFRTTTSPAIPATIARHPHEVEAALERAPIGPHRIAAKPIDQSERHQQPHLPVDVSGSMNGPTNPLVQWAFSPVEQLENDR